MIFNRAAIGRGGSRFTCFFVFVFFFSSWVERHIFPLGHIVSWTSNHATYDVSSPKVVETVTHGQCYAYCFLYCAKNIFLSGFIKALDSKGILL